MSSRLRRAGMTLAALLALGVAGCGGNDDDGGGSTATQAATAAKGTDLNAIKQYLLAHTERLVADTGKLRADAEAYYALAKGADFDYGRLLADKRSEVAATVKKLQTDFADANPAYEQMEGVVAGVPSLADFDVIIDAGGDASDPENAVPFSVKTPAGRTFKQPGNFNYLIETSTFGTEPRFVAKGVKPDLDGDGDVAFGEALPDADFLVAAARDFETSAKELDAAARKWSPTQQDAFTALVVMTPTMSEYFEAWKNSRFIAGDEAEEKAFVVASRLQDIADILGGLNLVYDNVEASIAKVDEQQANQTGASLEKLQTFAEDLRKQEAGGKKFTAQDADTLGGEAQDQAEAIAGQVTQAAGQLGIKLED
jgi:hypothetical protein